MAQGFYTVKLAFEADLQFSGPLQCKNKRCSVATLKALVKALYSRQALPLVQDRKQTYVAVERSAVRRQSVGRGTKQSVVKLTEAGGAGRRLKPSKGRRAPIGNVRKAFKPSDRKGLRVSQRLKTPSGASGVKTLR